MSKHPSRRAALRAAFAAALSLWMAACGPPPPAPAGGAAGSKVIGFAGPLTGPSAQFGVQMRRGAELAIEALNAAGGVKGVKLAAQYEDDAANPREAGSVAQKLASNPNVVAVVGHFNSSCSLAGKPKYGEAGVVQITPASTNVKVCQGSDWTFRNIYDDAFQGQTLATYAKTVLGLKRVAIFFDNDDYGIGLKDSFLAQANKEGLEVVFIQAYGRETTDYRPHLSRFAELKPEAIMVAGLFDAAAKIAKQARELGIGVPLLGGDGVLSDEYIKLGQAAADNTYISCPFLFELGGAKAEDFRKKYEAKYSQKPDAWAALAFDAVNILAAAIDKAGWERKAIRNHLASMSGPGNAFAGVTGVTFFDANGDCKKPIQMAVVRDGKIVAAPKQLQ